MLFILQIADYTRVLSFFFTYRTLILSLEIFVIANRIGFDHHKRGPSACGKLRKLSDLLKAVRNHDGTITQ